MQRNPARGVQLSLLCLLILGFLPVITGARSGDGQALAFAFWLSFWQLALALPVYLWQRRTGEAAPAPAGPRRFSRPMVWVLTLVTGGLFGVATFVYVLGVEQAGPVSFAVALQAYPLFALLWEALFLRRRKSPLELGLMLVIAGGMVHLGTRGAWAWEAVAQGFWLALTVPLLWSIAHVVIKELMADGAVTPSEVILTRVGIAAVLLGAACLAREAPSDLLATALSPRFQGLAVLMGVAYYLELIAWFHAVRHIDVSRGAAITAPAPALTVLLALVFLGQALHAYQAVALVLVVASVLALIRLGRRQAAPA